MFRKFEIWSVKRNRAGIENNIKIGSIGLVESGRNRGNPIILKENPFLFFTFRLIEEKTRSVEFQRNTNFENSRKLFSVESFEKLFLWYDMYVHNFNWFSKPNFSKKKEICQNFFNLFFPHSPQCIKNIKKFNFGRPYKLNTQSHVPNLTKFCLWCVQLASAWDTHKVICKQRIPTLSTLFITYVWKWLSPKELHNLTPRSLRKHACNHDFFFFFFFCILILIFLLFWCFLLLTNVQ